ncbi:MAG TPA: hypothetical protein VMU27_02695 [Candidatus Paceibacterota bacterium]|nr:hypothetical protein [Candidatus Paceibacterota bacterium]
MTNNQPIEVPGTCSLTSWSFYSCIGTPILGWIATVLLTIGGFFLEVAGALFDLLVQYVIIGFGDTLSNKLGLMGPNGAITIGWDVFRDLANILIIGMFVFIAISTILGSKEYGYKRLVARVLVIAVLMNFSLLFAELVIDASNFTAYQFYNQMAGGNTNNFDISSAFMAPVGVTSIWNTQAALQKYQQNTQAQGLGMLGFGIAGFLLFITLALVLLYGVVLIAIRAVVLIVIMLTASAAFATYLIPNFAQSKYGWKGWWEALINCAIFAPLLMLFLDISLLIISKASPAAGNNFGTLIHDPTQISTYWQVPMTYLLAVGLLYVSLKIASQFATAGSGFNPIATAASLATNFATGGLGSVAAFAGRNTIGRAAQGRLEGRLEEAKSKQSQAAAHHALSLDTKLSEAERATHADTAKKLEKEASKTSTSFTTGFLRNVAGANFGGQKSYHGVLEERAKAAEKTVSTVKPEVNEARQQAQEIVEKKRAPAEEELKAKVETARTKADEEKKPFETALNTAKEAQVAAEKHIEDERRKRDEAERQFREAARNALKGKPEYEHQKNEEEDGQSKIKQLHIVEQNAIDEVKSAKAANDVQRQEKAQDELDRIRREQPSQMTQQQERIKAAQTAARQMEEQVPDSNVQELRRRYLNLEKDISNDTTVQNARQEVKKNEDRIQVIEKPVKEAEEALAAHRRETIEMRDRTVRAAAASLPRVAEETARGIGIRQGKAIPFMTTKADRHVGEMVVKKVKTSRKNERITEVFGKQIEKAGSDEKPAEDGGEKH